MSGDNDEQDKISKKRRKKAPPGYYTRAEAQELLGLAPSTFTYYVSIGKISRIVVPPRTEGYYPKKEIDALVSGMALALALPQEDDQEKQESENP